MDKPERRSAERRTDTFTVSLAVAAPLELEGYTVNLSSAGVLLTARGKIPVILDAKGHRYRGELVRAFAEDAGTTAYAIQLVEALDEPA